MGNIVDTVVDLSGAPGTTDNNNADFDLLRDAVITAGLAGALSDPNAELTVFAPNDAAFIGLAVTLGYSGADEAGAFAYIVDALTLLGGGDPIPLLQSVLTYHVTPGEFFLADVAALGDGASIPTLQGGALTLDLTAPGLGDLDPALPDPNLIGFDVDADNGVIHVLDGVLLPLAVSSVLSQPGTDFIIGDDSRGYYSTGSGNDFVDGNGGKDIIRAGSGDDVAIGGAGRDKLYGGKGNDTLDGGTGKDKLFGGKGNDILDGGSGKDKLFGGSGDDTIDGGAGNDKMFGGSGSDTFVFGEGSGHDTIMFFENGKDKIDLSGYGIESFDEIAHAISGGFFQTTLDLGEDASIKLFGTWGHQLDESDFIFA